MDTIIGVDKQEIEKGSVTKSLCLVDFYDPDQCVYFSSPKYSILAKPPFANLLDVGIAHLSDRISESLRLVKDLGHKNLVVVGAIPFDIDAKSYLRLSTNFERSNVQIFKSEKVATTIGKDYTIKEIPQPHVYISGVKEALSRFAKGELDKVVLSRTLEINCQKKPDIKSLVKRLELSNTSGYIFAVKLQESVNNEDNNYRTLIGASPELLVSRRGSQVIANPLAGSESRSDDPIIDKQRADQLLRSEKDRREHALVVEAVADALAPLCKNLQVPQAPQLTSTPAMWHLSTLIKGTLRNPDTSSIELALAMHPTPAVCGYPKQEAKAAINEIENYDRGLFTGMVGWCDDSGDGEWVVTIRCAEISSNTIRLYAGAGVVAGSNPEKELAETGAKFNTMLHALGINEIN